MDVFYKKILIFLFSILIFLGGFFYVTPVLAITKLAVPFSSQAPYGIWTQPWQDACEEAVILMANAFYTQTPKIKFTKQAVKKEIEQIVRLELKRFGHHRDTPAAEMVEIINNYYPWEAKIIENPTLAALKNEIDAGRPVLLPVYGRALHNPNFMQGGPDYHTILLAGYDDEKQEFIAEEPGTRHGLDFRYSYATIMDAMHDFLPKNTKNGKKMAIFTNPEITFSGEYDADKDGLTKSNEIKYKTVLFLSDSDGDGYSDGAEVKAGYSPTSRYNIK